MLFRVERRETDKRTDCIDFPGFDSLETRCIVILVISWAREGRPNGAVLLESNKLGSKCYSTQRSGGMGEWKQKVLAIDEPFLISPSWLAQ